jgi:hypothetical protein
MMFVNAVKLRVEARKINEANELFVQFLSCINANQSGISVLSIPDLV